MKIQLYFQGQRMEHLLQSGVSLSNPKQVEFIGVVGQVAGNDKTGFRNFNYATQSNVALVLQLSL